jgi:hypothetical protein
LIQVKAAPVLVGQHPLVPRAGTRVAMEERLMQFAMPESLRAEHEELRGELVHAMRMEGSIGEAARALASLLHLHFGREDEYVLLPLGLLQPVSQGRVVPGMEAAVRMADQLKLVLAELVAEHGEIRGAAERLRHAAAAEARPRIVAFAERLMRHARQEEEVLYPAAILLGEYLRSRPSPDCPQAGARP